MTSAPDLQILLDISQMAELFRVSKSTVYRWIADGKLKALEARTPSPGITRYVKSKVLKYIENIH
jgi:transposase